MLDGGSDPHGKGQCSGEGHAPSYLICFDENVTLLLIIIAVTSYTHKQYAMSRDSVDTSSK